MRKIMVVFLSLVIHVGNSESSHFITDGEEYFGVFPIRQPTEGTPLKSPLGDDSWEVIHIDIDVKGSPPAQNTTPSFWQRFGLYLCCIDVEEGR